MRLIDTDALRKKAQWVEIPDWRGINFDVEAVSVSSIDLAPTIEAEPVKHGRWIEHIDHEMLTGYDECSVCHFGTIGQSNYCPNCGARMDGEQNG